MAIKDVKHYFYTMLMQYLEEKQNLADFTEALENNLITEEQMQEALDTVADLENNYYRLAYIMYLLDMPNKKENTDALIHFKAALKALKKDE